MLGRLDHYKNGYRHGECRKFDEKGNLIKKEKYLEGELSGEIIECHYRQNCVIEAKYRYKDPSKRTCIVSRYDWRGRLESDKNIKDGQKNGFLTVYYKNGVIASKTKYKDDKIHGLLTEYNENGKAVRKEKYNNGFRKGITYYFYYDSGTLKKKSEYLNYSDEYDEFFGGEEEPDFGDFLLHEESNYDDEGRLILKKRHYDGGVEKILVEYFYYPNGRNKEKINYEKDEIKRYFESGRIREIQGFIESRDGKLLKYYTNGNLESETFFTNGNPQKKRCFNEFGNPKAEELYFEDGTLKAEKIFNHSDRSVILNTYYPTGQLKSEEKYIVDDNDNNQLLLEE